MQNKIKIKEFRNKMKCLVFVCLCVFLFSSQQLKAQTSDFAGNVGYEVSKKIARSWDITLWQELRFNENMTNYCRFETTLGGHYSFLHKKAKAGVSYSFLNRENNDHYYENRSRFAAQLSYKESFRKVKLSWRGKFQSTYRDENRGDYKVNPKNYLRNRFQLDYKIVNSRFEPRLSFEFFYLLNGPEGNRIDELRTTLGFDYVLTRRASLEVFLRMDNEIQMKDPANVLMLGVFYKYSF